MNHDDPTTDPTHDPTTDPTHDPTTDPTHEMVHETTLEARLRGASTRLAAVLDPSVPTETPVPSEPAVEHLRVVATATTSSTALGRAKSPLRGRPAWVLSGAAAAVVAMIGTGTLVRASRDTRVDSRAMPKLETGASRSTAPTTVAAGAVPDTAAASEVIPGRDPFTHGVAETAPPAVPDTIVSSAGRSPVPADDLDETRENVNGAPGSAAETLRAGEDRFRRPPVAGVPTTAGPGNQSALEYRLEPPNTVPAFSVPTAVRTIDDPQSTFALDVDTGSYTRLRERVRSGQPIDPNEVRTEELLNAFDQDYRSPGRDAFAVHVDGTRVPFLPDETRVVRVGVQAKAVDPGRRKPVSLTFVVDVSGSMQDGDKLELVKQSLTIMVNQLDRDDTVAVVAFSDNAWIVLEPTSADQRDRIVGAISTMVPTNSTNAEAGLRLGYTLAQQSYRTDKINRVVLASDGVANVGPTGPEQISADIRAWAGKGIQLVSVGVGQGAYNDRMMEQLADQGDGFYTYIDGPRQAFKVFAEELTGTLQAVALDAKAQVSFDPSKVVAYRLLGYENRAVADHDFRNDRVDAAEIGAGHSATALYVVELVPGASGRIGRVDVRWTDPESRRADEVDAEISTDSFSSELTRATPRLQQDVYIAAWAEAIRGGPWGARADLQTLASRVPRLAELIPGDPDVADLVELIRRSAGLPVLPAPFPVPPATLPPPTTQAW